MIRIPVPPIRAEQMLISFHIDVLSFAKCEKMTLKTDKQIQQCAQSVSSNKTMPCSRTLNLLVCMIMYASASSHADMTTKKESGPRVESDNRTSNRLAMSYTKTL